MGVVGKGLLVLIKAILFVYDFVTYPIYTLVQKPWVKKASYAKTRSVTISHTDAGITITPIPKMNPALQDLIDSGAETMAQCFQYALKKHSHNRCLGTRARITEEDEVQPDGNVFKKWEMGDYSWQSFVDVEEKSTSFGKGLREMGQKYRQNICFFADTNAEWMIAAQACFKQTFPVVTLYTNLDDDAIVHGINQTEVEIVLTSHDLLPKFKNILARTPTVRTIIFIEDQIHSTATVGYKAGVQIVSFKQVIANGKDSSLTGKLPTASDPAIIMYTSGSTGVPKGVVLPHSSLVSTVKSFNMVTTPMESDDIYLGYLPLAHILELLSESNQMVLGVAIGYSSPNTLIDTSTKIKEGSKGDCSVLQPTLMCAVPLVLDRIYKGIHANLNKKGDFFQSLFLFCYRYKLDWLSAGYSTPILDRVIFKKVKALVGGRLRYLLCGGAPLSPETHEFLRVCLGLPLCQGYGLTESAACGSIMDSDDISTGSSGPPLQGVQFTLINWDEGNYRVTDKPYPRGEIVIGGGNVATGYYKMPAKTAEDFFTDDKGVRWFRTGDVGQIEENGNLRIVDRKKDLIKLQFGEYISLGKVEAELKTCTIVENLCVYADPLYSFVVLLVVPDKLKLDQLAEKLNLVGCSFEELCKNQDINGAILREICLHGKKAGLKKFELPGAVTLCQEIWTPESGLVTAAFKLKRKPIQHFYEKELKRMYGSRSA